jgi:hypothetical protein
MSDSWDDDPTGAKMADADPGLAMKSQATESETKAASTGKSPAVEPPVKEKVDPQVRISPHSHVETFTIPDLGGLTIGKQWHEVSSEQLTEIQTSATDSGVELEVKEGTKSE